MWHRSAASTDGLAPTAAAPCSGFLALELSLDPTNFFTWTYKNWKQVVFDQICVPSDQTQAVVKTKRYLHLL